MANYTQSDKIAYYKKRASDKSLSQSQRDYAQSRLNDLYGKGCSAKGNSSNYIRDRSSEKTINVRIIK